MLRLTFIAMARMPSSWWNWNRSESAVVVEVIEMFESPGTSLQNIVNSCGKSGVRFMAKTKSNPAVMTKARWDRMLSEADRHWQEYIEHWPPAKSVRYDRATKRVVVQLVNGLRLEVPATKLQGVAAGTDRERADVRCIGDGTCLEWRALDQHFSIEGLLTGRFGNNKWMESLARGRSGLQSIARTTKGGQLRHKRGTAHKIAEARS